MYVSIQVHEFVEACNWGDQRRSLLVHGFVEALNGSNQGRSLVVLFSKRFVIGFKHWSVQSEIVVAELDAWSLFNQVGNQRLGWLGVVEERLEFDKLSTDVVQLLFRKVCVLLQDSSFHVFNGCSATEQDIPQRISPAFLSACKWDLRVDHIGEGSDFTCISDGNSDIVEAITDVLASWKTVTTVVNFCHHFLNDVAKQIGCDQNCMGDVDPLSGEEMMGCFESGEQRAQRVRPCHQINQFES